MIRVELTRPWLLAAIVPAVAVLAYYFYRSLSDFPRRQRWVSLATRACIVLLVVLALAGLTLLHTTEEKYFILAVDQSTSIGDNAVKAAEDFLKDAMRHSGNHQLAYLPFARTSGKVQYQKVEFGERQSILGPPSTASREAPPANVGGRETSTASTDAANNDARDGTDLAAAIETAARYMPPGYVPQIVILSDGNETAGDALAAASRSKVPVSTVALPARVEPEVQVSSVGVPAEVRQTAERRIVPCR
jgi:hypothetical protein